jgi:hypothetical protein
MGESRESVLEQLRTDLASVRSSWLDVRTKDLEALIAVVEVAQELLNPDSDIWRIRDSWAFPREELEALRVALAALTSEQKP